MGLIAKGGFDGLLSTKCLDEGTLGDWSVDGLRKLDCGWWCHKSWQSKTLGRANVKRSPLIATQTNNAQTIMETTNAWKMIATYLSCAVLRRAFRLWELALPALPAITVVVPAVAAGAAAHHVEGVVGVRGARDGGIDVVRACRVGGHVVVAMDEMRRRRLVVRMLLLLLLLLRLVLVWWVVDDCSQLGS
jgi:hypothetical protein